MPSSYPKRVQVIRNRHGYLMGFYQRGRSYVVGFPSPMYTKRVQQGTTQKSRMFLSNHLPNTIPHDVVYRTLKGADGARRPVADVESVAMDTTAHLNIEKRLIASPADLIVPSTRVDEVSFEEFLMYPFRRNLGIVLPMELMMDHKSTFVFQCHVVDPCYDPVLFQPVLC